MATLGRLQVDLIANAQKFVREIRDAESAFQKTSRKMNDIGRTLTAGVTLPIAAVGAAAFKMAADSAEAASKMQAVFGGATQDMNTWIADLRDTIPETTVGLQAMTSEIGDLLVPLGIAPDKAQAMTRSVVELSGDLASFNNIPMAEALERIRSGLVGQNEPLLKFGVAINAADVKARALALGLIKGGEAVNASARAQASFSLILEKTTAAHGDAAKTAGSAANQLKFFWAEARELATVVGGELLPVITPLVSGLTDLLKGLQQIDPVILRFTVTVAGLAATIGPLLLLASALTAGLVALNPVVLAVGVAITGIAAAIAVWGSSQEDASEQTRQSTEALSAYRKQIQGASADVLEKRRATLDLLLAEAELRRHAIEVEVAQIPLPVRQGKGAAIQTDKDRQQRPEFEQLRQEYEELGRTVDKVNAHLDATNEALAQINDQISTVTDDQRRRSAELVESLRTQKAEQERLLAAAEKSFDASAEVTSQIDTERTVRVALANAIEEDAEQVENLVRATIELEEATNRATEALEEQKRESEEAARRTTSIQALEDEVEAMHEMIEAAREGEAAMERLRLERAAGTRVQELGTDATGEERTAISELTMELGELQRELEKVIREAGEAADSSADSSKSFQRAWISAINAVGAGLGGIGQDLASIGVGAISGGLPGAATAAAGVLGRLFGGGGEKKQRSEQVRREQARLAQEAERAAKALRKLTASTEDNIRIRRLVVQGLNDEAAALRLQINQQKELGELAERFQAEFGLAPDAVDAFVAEFISSFDSFGDEIGAEIDSWGSEIGVAIVESEVARFADALATYVELQDLHNQELAALYAEQAQREEEQRQREQEQKRELQRQGRESELDFGIRSATLGGDSRGAFLLGLQRDQEGFLRTLQDLKDAGAITEEALLSWGDLLDAEATQAIKEFDQALLDAAQAIREAQLAFAEALEIDILRQEGQDQEADTKASEADADRRIQEAKDLGFDEGDPIFDRIQTWLKNRLDAIAEKYAGVSAGGRLANTDGLDVASSARRAVKRSTVVLGSAQVSDLLRRQLVVQETYLPFLRSIEYKTGGGVSVGAIDRGLGQTHRHGSRVSGGAISV